MLEENIEIVKRLYEEFLEQPDGFASPEIQRFFDPEAQVRQSASLVGTEGTFHGYEALASASREVSATFRETRFLDKRLLARGDQVVALVEMRGRGRQSGVEVSAEVGHVWSLRNGLILAWDVYLDHAEALEAVGMGE